MNQASCFTSFTQNISSIPLPERFTFPHCYEPHPLCVIASDELQQKLLSQTSLKAFFEQSGKMFGVLLVKNAQGELGYISGFSGKGFANDNKLNMVPAIFELTKENSQNSFFHHESDIINRLNNTLIELEANPKLSDYQLKLEQAINAQNEQLENCYQLMAHNRKCRKAKRIEIKATLQNEELALQLSALANKSVQDKNQLRDLKRFWQDEILAIEQPLLKLKDEILDIKKTRKKLSTKLQKKLFKQYRLLNIKGEEKDVLSLFKQTPFPMPPAGTGDCAAPKLLQYAFLHNLKPLAMAEFWWGKAPTSEIRQHKNFYPACSGKCQPILGHMLEGLKVDKNSLLINPGEQLNLTYLYHDEDMVVVNKPSGLLSVPGKNIKDSVYERVKEKFPQATGSLVVHRLDMSTSGIMILALTKRAQKNLQQQFISRSIKKCYVAILEGDIAGKFPVNGEITLPLRGDLDDRPRQLVCVEHGKKAKTQWQIIETQNGRTKLFLYPETGRTHQLRVHCAHPDGLSMPIAGDDLYGSKEPRNIGHGNISSISRLCLHAKTLELHHPVTREVMIFEIEEDF
jgi:tRNA pseudouridine32 synthase/23S rRNA pseudouridine746 synthase